MYALCWARSLRGHCVNAPHLPADCSPDWLLMTFLGHRHVKLFIYSKKKKSPMQIALSPLYISLPPTQVRVGISVSVSASASWNSDDVLRSSAKLSDITAGQLFLLFTHVCVCVWVRVLCVSVRRMHVTDMGHPWEKWHNPYRRSRSKRIFSRTPRPQFSGPLSEEITELL